MKSEGKIMGNKVQLSVAAIVGAVAGAGIYPVAYDWILKDCYKEVVVDGVSKIYCEKRLSCTNPPWKNGNPCN